MNGETDDTTSFVDMGRSHVRVRVVGEGPPLLLVMGLGGNLNMWDPLVDRLPGRQLIMFDFPGTGASGRARFPPTMGFNALFVRLLIRKLGFERVDVLGYSWGGILAQHLAIQHPRVVRHLVLASTTPGLGGMPPGPVVTTRMLTPRRYYSPTYFTKIAPALYGGRFRREAGLVNDEVKRRVGRPPSLVGYASQLTALMGYSTLPGLRFVSAPTLIIAGGDDPIVPAFNARLLARCMPHATMHLIPDAGHLVLVDSPEIVGPIIEDFLASEVS